jgi:hypothetical protein
MATEEHRRWRVIGDGRDEQCGNTNRYSVTGRHDTLNSVI